MTQEQIRRQMAANSASWGAADAAGRARLHAENQRLAAQLDALTGGESRYSASGGGWTLSRSGQSTPRYQAPLLRGPTDQSEYVKQMHKARQDAALAELKRAYEQNLQGQKRAAAEITGTYQTARNQAAGSAAIERRNFAEYAAARGLGSGAAAQAELAREVALQGALSDIGSREASARADARLRQEQLETEYRNAVAQAKAAGDADLAAALYREMTRLDEARQETQLNQADLYHKTYQSALRAQRHQIEDAHWEHEQNAAAEQAERQWSYQAARDALSDWRYGEETAYQRQQDEYEKAYQRQQDEYRRQQEALKQAADRNQKAYDNALARWRTLGYLDAESARVLGLPQGTPTSAQVYQSARILAMWR